ncbi:MAG: helix-turn-helix transcriptional regulator [Candidatus Kerfeldbacteria bacterium]|nr:helix-turn-helix transcriptional regulator [Candidatus Kerfeldbacteria bacterium]
MPRIGQIVRQLRRQRGLSQGKLAAKAKVSLNTIVKLEIGDNTNPTVGTLATIARALGVSIHKLIP